MGSAMQTPEGLEIKCPIPGQPISNSLSTTDRAYIPTIQNIFTHLAGESEEPSSKSSDDVSIGLDEDESISDDYSSDEDSSYDSDYDSEYDDMSSDDEELVAYNESNPCWVGDLYDLCTAKPCKWTKAVSRIESLRGGQGYREIFCMSAREHRFHDHVLANPKFPFGRPLCAAIHKAITNAGPLELVQKIIKKAEKYAYGALSGTDIHSSLHVLALREEQENNTPLHLASIFSNDVEIVKTIITSYPQALNAKNFHGLTPLQYAETRTALKNRYGDLVSPWTFAEKRPNHADVVKVLKQKTQSYNAWLNQVVVHKSTYHLFVTKMLEPFCALDRIIMQIDDTETFFALSVLGFCFQHSGMKPLAQNIISYVGTDIGIEYEDRFDASFRKRGYDIETIRNIGRFPKRKRIYL
mmetsp:Transcript_5216/g.6817  ORF Transcript_5216/g.6817 Transcript_5216/m.6817 type:complete len:411 (-) Transcript_5216:184-1416(-)